MPFRQISDYLEQSLRRQPMMSTPKTAKPGYLGFPIAALKLCVWRKDPHICRFGDSEHQLMNLTQLQLIPMAKPRLLSPIEAGTHLPNALRSHGCSSRGSGRWPPTAKHEPEEEEKAKKMVKGRWKRIKDRRERRLIQPSHLGVGTVRYLTIILSSIEGCTSPKL